VVKIIVEETLVATSVESWERDEKSSLCLYHFIFLIIVLIALIKLKVLLNLKVKSITKTWLLILRPPLFNGLSLTG
jgi:hypothetical protein